MTIDKVKKLISTQLNVAESKITEDSRLVEDLGADSLDVVDLISVIEDEFDLEIPEEAVDSIKTVGDIVNYIEKNASAE